MKFALRTGAFMALNVRQSFARNHHSNNNKFILSFELRFLEKE
jgi:hypothetical protein